MAAIPDDDRDAHSAQTFHQRRADFIGPCSAHGDTIVRGIAAPKTLVFVGFTAEAFDDREATEHFGKYSAQHLELLLSTPIEYP